MTSYLWFCLIETGSAVVQATVQDLKDCGFDCWETSIGGPGVQQHALVSVKEEILEVLNRYWTLHLFDPNPEAGPGDELSECCGLGVRNWARMANKSF